MSAGRSRRRSRPGCRCDFAGVVVDGPTEWIGVEVWGTGGDVGFSRDGSHAELRGVLVGAVARKAPNGSG